MFLQASLTFSSSHLNISRDTNNVMHPCEDSQGSIAPLSRTRQGKPGFTYRSRERSASETAEHKANLFLITRPLHAETATSGSATPTCN